VESGELNQSLPWAESYANNLRRLTRLLLEVTT